MTRWMRWTWRVAWCWLLGRPAPLKTVKVAELPDELEAKKVYVAGENGFEWFAAMLCPCGCGATLHMSLIPGARPRWSLTVHKDGTLTIHPSVWRLKDCRSHFFLRRGLIVWC